MVGTACLHLPFFGTFDDTALMTFGLLMNGDAFGLEVDVAESTSEITKALALQGFPD